VTAATAGGIEVRLPTEPELLASVVDRLSEEDLAARLAANDPSLWPSGEAVDRLAWLGAPSRARSLPGMIARSGLATEPDKGLVLLGMGGSSLAGEVVCQAGGRPLAVLDTTDCDQTARVLSAVVAGARVVVASKSGQTVETDAQFRIAWAALRRTGLGEAETATRFIAVTDPGSVLARTAETAGIPVVLADPRIGGRYSALTPFGLVPAAVRGLDVGELVEQAVEAVSVLGRADGPATLLGAALGAHALAGRNKLATVTAPELPGIGDWLEQLLAESSGKDGKGILPIPAGAVSAMADCVRASIGSHDGPDLSVSGPLGAQFVVWEWATVVAARVLGVNPFDQPNVEESKANTAALLTSAARTEAEPLVVDVAVEVFADPATWPELRGIGSVRDLVELMAQGVEAPGYLAVMGYLDRYGDDWLPRMRDVLAARAERPVTFGWGPRFLHSTGQFHKGGPQVGRFCQVTGAVTQDIPVPGREYTLGQLQRAQAAGDFAALHRRGLPVVRIHLRDRADGAAQLAEALRGAGGGAWLT
jgi:glucose-6-phosphate isomerase